jgi:hypothetical protein
LWRRPRPKLDCGAKERRRRRRRRNSYMFSGIEAADDEAIPLKW